MLPKKPDLVKGIIILSVDLRGKLSLIPRETFTIKGANLF